MGKTPFMLAHELTGMSIQIERYVKTLQEMGYPKVEEGHDHRDIQINFAIQAMQEAHRLLLGAAEARRKELEQARQKYTWS